MSEPLPIRITLTFMQDLKSLIPKKKRKNVIWDLERISKVDLLRYHNLKSPLLSVFRSYHKGDFRILFVYCNQCYNEFNHGINCNGCNEDDLEKLVIMKMDHRSNAYRDNRQDLRDFTLVE